MTIKIKNVSGGPYAIEELAGHVIADDEELDLLNDNLPVCYANYKDANRLVTGDNVASSKLWTDIQAGDITVTENTD